MASDGRTVFDDISPTAWEHPSDRVALNALRELRGFDTVLRKLVGLLGFEFSNEAVGDAAPEESEQEFQDQLDTLLLDTDDFITQISDDWTNAQADNSLVIPSIPRTPSSPESIAAGRVVYLPPNAKSATCPGEAGLGNGDQTLLVQQGETEPGLFDKWGNPILPRDLTSGIYRGGRRPLDIYRRIHSGIKGTPMTGFRVSAATVPARWAARPAAAMKTPQPRASASLT